MKNETKFKINLQYFTEDQKGGNPTPPPTDIPDDGNNKGDKIEFSSAEEFQKAYKKLQEESVPKSLLEEKNAQIADLTKAVIEGTTISKGGDGQEDKPSINELAKSMLEDGIGNLEFAKRTLKYRKAVIEETGQDPFVALNSEDPEVDGEKAANVADVLQDCIDKSGDSETVFTAMFNQRIKDTPLANAAKGRVKRA